MSLVFRYANADSSWNVDLGTSVVRLGTLSVTEIAAVGQPASSSILLDDPTGSVGHSGDGILGLKSFVVLENAAPVNDQRIFTGYLGDRRYRRGPASGDQSSLRVGVARVIDCDLVELDAAFGFSLVPPTDTTGNRPAESPAARLTWLLGTGYVDMADHGLVVYPTTPVMDPADYRNQYPANVMADLAMAVGYNFWLYIDDTIPAMSLWFDNPNTSTAYTSTLQLSNVLSDLDTTTAASFLTGTTFAMDAIEVTVSPDRVESGLSITYASGSTYLTRPTTGVTYAARDRVAPNSNLKTAAMAVIEATRMLRENSTEDATVTCSVDVPAAKVNAIRKGHRIQAKVSFMSAPVDYTAYAWFRVMQRTVRQGLTPDRYTLDLKLSPQETSTTVCGSLALTLDGDYWPLGGATDFFNATDGINPFYMCRPGLAFPVVPTTGFIGRWFFKTFGSSGGGPGTVDSAGDGVGNTLRAVVVGNGTLTVQTVNVEGVGTFNVTVKRQTNPGTPTSESDFTIVSTTAYSTGDAYSVTIDDAVSPYCVSIIEADTIASKDMGWSGGVWVSAP